MPSTFDELNAAWRAAVRSLHYCFGSDTAPGYAEQFLALGRAFDRIATYKQWTSKRKGA
jgi:hypothetical protein